MTKRIDQSKRLSDFLAEYEEWEEVPLSRGKVIAKSFIDRAWSADKFRVRLAK
jgi:hypothetical protein